MNVIVASKDINVTQAIRDFIQLQTERKLLKINKRIAQIRVYLEHIAKKEGDPKRASAKIKVFIPGKKTVLVKGAAHNLYDAIVNAADSAMRKIRKVKEKKLDKQRISTNVDNSISAID